jgi:hypothetical protein
MEMTAMTDQKRTSRVITPKAILSYPHLFEPSAPSNDPNAKAKYSATFVFPADTDLSGLKEAARTVAVEKFGEKRLNELIAKGKFRSPFRTDDLQEKGYPEGSVYVGARSDTKPGIVSRFADADGKPKLIDDPAEIYPGCIVRGSLRPFAYDVAGNVGVSFALQNVQKLEDGERLDSRKNARDEFDAEPVSNSDVADLL